MTCVPYNIEPSDTIVPKKAPNQEPTLELHSRAAPSVEAHHCVNGPDRKKFRRKADKKKLR